MAVNNEANLPKIEKTTQEIDNLSFDTTYNVKVVEGLGHDGQGVQRKNADNMATKITVVSDNTYIGVAKPGTAEATAKWQCKKIAVAGGTTTITWADGNADFDNVATDLTALTYS